MTGLAPIDAWAIAAILAKALEYGTALLALGGPLFIVTFREAHKDVLRVARSIAIAAAFLCVALIALRFGIRSARISGMGMDGMTDTMMLGLIWESPLGSAAVLRGLGTLLVLAIALGGNVASLTALIGSVLIAVSYTQVGHSLSYPRWLLVGLLSVHLLTAGFWIAALAPLHQAARLEFAGILLHRFGVVASGTVPALVIVGLTFAWLMTGSVNGLFSTAYGWTLLTKMIFFSGLLSLAALNKFKLVPSLENGDEHAASKLRRSIKIEGFFVLLILISTATLTSVTTPPVNL
ncbi:copper resistance D family protein [Ruegeria profundi]|uniref:copper resistance D family protein n=1 Tax=Ruegeria profundi TaxID=1685378 RepID=UPI001CD32AC5|nr:CopD family protein [Ruegeria profundi]MCA0930702.1 CopD family protein [Ruegeria profundi]